MLAVTIVQPIYTSTSDVVGRKIPLYIALLLFAVGSIVFAVAQSMGVLICGRVLQGLGGGGLDVLNEIIVADITTLKERPLYIGLMALPMAAGSILGPILGSLFSEYVDWRWIGWINLPLIAVITPMTIFCLRLKAIEQSLWTRLKRLDWIGMLLFGTGSTLFALPLSWAGELYPWGSWRTIVPLAIGILVLAGFGAYEAKPAEAVFPYRIFAPRTAAATLAGAFIHGMVMYALLLYLPLFFQAVHLEAPLQSAISMLPICVSVVVFTGAGAVTVDYVRRYTWVIWTGWVFLAAGVGLLIMWDSSSSVAMMASFQVIAGIGLGIVFVVPSIPMQASAKADDQGIAAGILVAFRLFGALIGLAVGATLFSSVFGTAIAELKHLPPAIAILDDPREAVKFIPHLRNVDLEPEVMAAVQDAYRQAFQRIWIILTSFGGAGFVVSLFTEELTLETEELGRQHFEHGTPASD
jgi:hypothetical protein